MIPKFRAWYGAEMYDEPVIHNGEFYLDWRDFIDGHTYDGAVLMQSTGLFDKSGVEIFEGDVVRFTVVNQAMCGIYEVRQAKSGAWRMDNAIQGREIWLAKPHSLEVIGNIHEHPELVEVRR